MNNIFKCARMTRTSKGMLAGFSVWQNEQTTATEACLSPYHMLSKKLAACFKSARLLTCLLLCCFTASQLHSEFTRDFYLSTATYEHRRLYWLC